MQYEIRVVIQLKSGRRVEGKWGKSSETLMKRFDKLHLGRTAICMTEHQGLAYIPTTEIETVFIQEREVAVQDNSDPKE